MTATLLPPNSTPFERAIEASMACAAALPAGRVAAVLDPDICPAELLSLLAWDLSIDLWDPAWPETKQRQLCRNAFRLHQLKTTPAGIRAHVEIAGGKVERIIRPPARGFLCGARTAAQHAAWLDRLPQIRIYPFANRAVARRRSFACGAGAGHQFGSWLRASRGRALLGRRATYRVGDVETPIALSGLSGSVVERVQIGSTADRRCFAGTAHAGTGWLLHNSASERIVTMRFADDAASFAVQPGTEPVDVRPTRVAQTRTAPAPRAFFGRHGGFLMPSAAPYLIYDRVSLHAKAEVGARRRVTSWGGRGKLGGAPFAAELRISVPMQRARRRAARWGGVGFLKGADMRVLDRVIEAVRTSKAARDTILIDTTNYETVRFGGSLKFGDFRFGEMRKV